MSDQECTRCGHDRRLHRKPTKREPWTCPVHIGYAADERGIERARFCPCSGFTTAVLPAGESLEFGRHRLPQDEAETAPAWPPIRG
jgi:hypothetical protein